MNRKQRARRRHRRSRSIVVRYADGSERIARPKEFRKTTKRDGYKRYLRSEHWKEMRAKALKRDDGRCSVCGDSEVQLEVHHLTYERLGHEELDDLVTLCQPCHATEHQWIARERRASAA